MQWVDFSARFPISGFVFSASRFAPPLASGFPDQCKLHEISVSARATQRLQVDLKLPRKNIQNAELAVSLRVLTLLQHIFPNQDFTYA
jgi:hypothetical protein